MITTPFLTDRYAALRARHPLKPAWQILETIRVADRVRQVLHTAGYRQVRGSFRKVA